MSLITESDLIKRDTIAVCHYLDLMNRWLADTHILSNPITIGRIELIDTSYEADLFYFSASKEAILNHIFLVLASEGYHIHYSPELNKLLLEPPPYDSLSKLIAQGITSANPDPSVTYSNSTNKYR